jgi:hypothetical protein
MPRAASLSSQADQSAHAMAALKKNGNQIAADIAGSSRDEDSSGVGDLGRTLTFSKSRMSEMDAATELVRSLRAVRIPIRER